MNRTRPMPGPRSVRVITSWPAASCCSDGDGNSSRKLGATSIVAVPPCDGDAEDRDGAERHGGPQTRPAARPGRSDLQVPDDPGPVGARRGCHGLRAPGCRPGRSRPWPSPAGTVVAGGSVVSAVVAGTVVVVLVVDVSARPKGMLARSTVRGVASAPHRTPRSTRATAIATPSIAPGRTRGSAVRDERRRPRLATGLTP